MVFVLLGLVGLVASGPFGPGDDLDALNPFGKTLARAEVIAVGKVVKVSHTARSTDVVQFQLVDVLKSVNPGGAKAGEKLTILAPRDTFFANTKLLVLLEPFGGGPRYECFARITESDVDFQAKVRVMRQYLRVGEIASRDKRLDALRRLVLRNIESPDGWTRWNALHSLESIVAHKPDLIQEEDVAGLRSLRAKLASGEFRTALDNVLEKLEEKERAA